jgi:hypothetical protein
MDAVYLDRGPGFFANDVITVMQQLGILLIFGEAAYPEGHGKVEAFNKTRKAAHLRGLDGRPDVDPDCERLTLRTGHYMTDQYNVRPHESLDGQSPLERFLGDERPLRFPASDAELRQRFVIHEERLVSSDHIVSLDSTAYEMPRGYARQKVILQRRILDDTLHFLHHGKYIQLHEVDLVVNAHDKRAKPQAQEDAHPHSKSAADLSYERDFHSVVGPDGGYPKKEDEE